MCNSCECKILPIFYVVHEKSITKYIMVAKIPIIYIIIGIFVQSYITKIKTKLLNTMT